MFGPPSGRHLINKAMIKTLCNHPDHINASKVNIFLLKCINTSTDSVLNDSWGYYG